MIHWMLFSTLATAVFYGLYCLTFKRDRWLQLSRWYLMGTLLFSLVYPLVRMPELPLPVSAGIDLPAVEAVGTGRALSAEETVVEGQPFADAARQVPTVLYFVGLMVVFASLVLQVAGTRRAMSVANKTGRFSADTARRVPTVVFLDDDTPPYSFFNNIIIGTHGMSDEDLQCVLAHEQEHVRRHHTEDVLLARLLCCVAWFNPFAWLLLRELRAVHEYQADASVTASHSNHEYLSLLYRQATGTGYGHITNKFNSINIKKRIVMMNKTKTRFGAWKVLAALPVAALLLMVGCKPAANQETDATAAQQEEIIADSNDTIYDGNVSPVEVDPEFPGGMEALYKYLAENIKYPEQAKTEKIQGRVAVSFVIEKDGSVSGTKVVRSIGGGCDEEALRVVNAMPKWTPGRMSGEPVRVNYVLPITFKLQ